MNEGKALEPALSRTEILELMCDAAERALNEEGLTLSSRQEQEFEEILDRAIGIESEEGRLSSARLALAAAARYFERRVRAVLATKIKDAFPEATRLHAVGEYNEDGLLKLQPRFLTRADGSVVAEADAATDAWYTLFEDDEVGGLLDDLAEHNGDDYLGTQEIDLS